MWKACIGFMGEIKKTYTNLDRKLKGTDAPIHRYVIMASLFFSNKNVC